MKFIGHASSAVILTAPLVYFRHKLSGTASSGLSVLELFGIIGFFSVLPDIDILLSRFTPIKHRGYLTHSLLTVFLVGATFLLCGVLLQQYPEQLQPITSQIGQYIDVYEVFTLYVSLLAMLAIFAHILGDSLTKTGVPLLTPKQTWHMPVIGGKAAFDNWALNLIPCVIAGFILEHWFGIGAGLVSRIGNLHLNF